MAVLQAVVTFALLLSLTSAGTLTCNNLIQPLNIEDYTAMTGKWILHAMAASDSLRTHIQSLRSSWLKISVDDQGKMNAVSWADRINADCVSGSGSVTQTGNGFIMSYDSKTYSGMYLQTCPDCLLYSDVSETGTGSTHMFLAKREGSAVQPSELETFRKQADCQNVPHVNIFQVGDLCPDQ